MTIGPGFDSRWCTSLPVCQWHWCERAVSPHWPLPPPFAPLSPSRWTTIQHLLSPRSHPQKVDTLGCQEWEIQYLNHSRKIESFFSSETVILRLNTCGDCYTISCHHSHPQKVDMHTQHWLPRMERESFPGNFCTDFQVEALKGSHKKSSPSSPS